MLKNAVGNEIFSGVGSCKHTRGGVVPLKNTRNFQIRDLGIPHCICHVLSPPKTTSFGGTKMPRVFIILVRDLVD